MFEELSLSTKSKNFEELNYIRIKFGFSELEIDPTIFCKTLTIKQEKLDDEDGKFQLWILNDYFSSYNVISQIIS